MTDRFDDRQTLIIDVLLDQASAEQIAEFDRLSRTDESFPDEVKDVEAWLSPLNTLADEKAPPPGLLDDIMSEIDALEDAPAEPEPAAIIRPLPPRPPSTVWRPVAIAASTIAAVSLGAHILPVLQPSPTTPTDQTQPEELFALMSGENAPSVIVIVYDPDERRVLAKLSNIDLPEDKAWQLWRLRDGDPVPLSLGLFEPKEDGRNAEFSLNDELEPASDVLAVSVEPPGGSPEAGPTGPVIFTGKVETL